MPLTDEQRARLRGQSAPAKPKPKVTVPSPAIRGVRTSSTAILAGQGPSPEEEIAWAIASSEEGFWDALVEAGTNLTASLPAMIGGGIAGGSAGGAAGATAGPVGAGVGATLGAGAGAFGADSAIKGAWRGYNEVRRDPRYKDMSFGEVIQGVASGAIGEGLKGSAIGALTAAVPYASIISKTPIWKATAQSKVGQLFTTATKGAFTSPLGKKALEFAGELGVLTVAPAAFDGSWPGWQDVAVNATLLGLFKGAMGNKSVQEALQKLVGRNQTIDDVLSDLTPEERASLKELPQNQFNELLTKFAERRLEAADKLERESSQRTQELTAGAAALEETATSQKLQTKAKEIEQRSTESKSSAVKRSESALEAASKAEQRKLSNADISLAKSTEEAQSVYRARSAQIEDKYKQDIAAAETQATERLEGLNKRISDRKQPIDKQAIAKEKAKAYEQAALERARAKDQLNKDLDEANKRLSKRPSEPDIAEKGKAAAQEKRAQQDIEISKMEKGAQSEFEKPLSSIDNRISQKEGKIYDLEQSLHDLKAKLASSPRNLVLRARERALTRDIALEHSRLNALDAQRSRLTRQAGKRSSDIAKAKEQAQKQYPKSVLEETAKAAKEAVKPINEAINQFKAKLAALDKAASRDLATIERRTNKAIEDLRSRSLPEAKRNRILDQISKSHKQQVEQALERQKQSLEKAKGSLNTKLNSYNQRFADLVASAKEKATADLERIDKSLKEELEAIDKRTQKKLEADLKEYQSKLESQAAKRVKSVYERASKQEAKAFKEASSIRERTNATVRRAKETGYFEVDARLLDPSAPRGSKIKSRFVERRPEDAGKTPNEVIASRIAASQKFSLREWGKELVQMAKSFKEGAFDKLKFLEEFAENPDQFIGNAKKQAEWIDAADSTVRYMLETAQFNYITHADIANSGLIPNLSKIFGGKKIDASRLRNVMVAMSSIDRQNMGQRNPVPTQDALDVINNKDRYLLAAQEIHRFIDTELQRYVDSGMKSQEQAHSMRKLLANYFPLNRLVDAAEQQYLRSTSLLPKDVIKRSKGSEKDILDPLEQFLKNNLAMERAMRKNEAMKALSHYIKRNGGDGMVRVDDPITKKEELQKLVGPETVVTDEMVGALNVFKNSTEIGEGVKKGYIYHYENGKRYETKIPVELHGAIRNLSPPEMGMIERGLNAWRNFFSKAVVTHPRTALKIAVLDPLIGLMQTKNSKLAYLKELFATGYPGALFKTKGAESLMNDFVKFGGARHSLQGLSRNQGLKGLADTVVNAAKEGDSGVKTLITAPVQALKASYDIMQKFFTGAADAPRLAEFKLSREKYLALGLDPLEANYRAAYDSWEVTVPYGREGAWKAVQLLNRIIPFSRTILASNQSFFKAVDPRTSSGRATIMAATAALTAPTLFFYLMNRNHPPFLAENEQTKNENILIYPSLITGVYDPYVYDPYEKPIKIPHLWQFGFMFQKLPESVLEYAINNEPDAVRNLIRDMEYNFSPLTFASVAEGIIAAEKSGHVKPEAFFQGRFGAAPKQYKTLEPEAQVNANTSETAKWLSENIPLAPSPIWIDQMINKIGAGWGDLATRLSDEVLIGAGAAEDRKPEENLIAQHLFGAFIGRGPRKYSAHLKKFYELADSQRAKYNTYNEYLKLDPAKAALYAKRTKWVSNKDINSMYKGIREYAQEIARTEYKASHNAAEKAAKTAKLMKLYVQMGELAEKYNKTLEKQIKALNG